MSERTLGQDEAAATSTCGTKSWQDLMTTEARFPKAMIECPHYISFTFGAEDICGMCGGRRKAVTECDHGVLLSEPCEKCWNKMPTVPFWRKVLSKMKSWMK
jgi:hypothetical protein